MGCQNSTAVPPKGETKPNIMQTIIQEVEKAVDPAEVYGSTQSVASWGPVLFTVSKNCGKYVPMTPEKLETPGFLAINPYRELPAVKDGDFHLYECRAILRYLSEKYADECYANFDVKRRGFIDWAMDRFVTEIAKDCEKIINFVVGSEPAEKSFDAFTHSKKTTKKIEEFVNFFLKEKFMGGDRVSIADFLVFPVFYALTHPLSKKKGHVEKLPERVLQFNKDFEAAVPDAVKHLHAITEALDAKFKELWGAPTVEKSQHTHVGAHVHGDRFKDVAVGGSGKVSIHGSPVSFNTVGCWLVVKTLNVGDLVVVEDSKTKEHLAVNPFGQVPAMKDGDFCMAETTSISRYLARSYGTASTYPPVPKDAALIDMACDRFQVDLYHSASKVLYPCMGFSPRPSDAEMQANGAALLQNLDQYCKAFLTKKFIGGETLSLADFKIAPFFFGLAHPYVQLSNGYRVPERIEKFNADFAAACPAASVMTTDFCLQSYLDMKEKQHADGKRSAVVKGEEKAPVTLHEAEVQNKKAQMCGFCCA